MTFRVGMKVVCVDDQAPVWFRQYLTVGRVYTVSWVGRASSMWEDQQACLRVAEVRDRELPFRATRFRPAVSPSISFDTSIPADPESEQYDNRRRVPVSEWGCSA